MSKDKKAGDGRLNEPIRVVAEVTGEGRTEVTGPDEGPAVIAFKARKFKTGSVGFYGGGKVLVDGVRYQATFLLVEIHSKEEGE